MNPTIKQYRPFLKWPGGKYKLVPILQEYIAPNKILVEPFLGAGSIFLNLDFKKYLLNDINPDLINLFTCLQTDVDNFILEAQKLFSPHYNTEKKYYQLRERFNESHSIIERAILFLYLNKHGFNGLCRYNSQGGYNVPYGFYKKPPFPLQEILYFSKKCIKHKIQFNNLSFVDFFKSLNKRKATELTIYCDPPYAPLTHTASFTTYTKQSFSLASQQELADLAFAISRKGAKVILSNHDTPFTREIYHQASEIVSIQVQRLISAKSSARKKINELIAIY